MEDTSRRPEPAAPAPCSCGDVLMLALVDATAGRRGAVDEGPGEGLTHAEELAPVGLHEPRSKEAAMLARGS